MKEQYRSKICAGGIYLAKWLNEQAAEGYAFLSMAPGEADKNTVIAVVEYHGDGEPPEVVEDEKKATPQRSISGGHPSPRIAGTGRRLY